MSGILVTSSAFGPPETGGSSSTNIVQYVVTFSVTLYLVATGFALGWSSPALPMIYNAVPYPPFHFELVPRSQTAWIVAFMEVGVLCAALPAAWLMDWSGRRGMLLAGCAPLAVSWLLIANATAWRDTVDVAVVLCVARWLAGTAFGIGLAVVPIYVGEIATTARIRGRLAVMVTVSVQLGVLLVYVLGTALSGATTQRIRMTAQMDWELGAFATLAWWSLAPVVAFAAVAALGWVPETPYWLLANGMEEEAIVVLQKLCGRRDVTDEWSALQAAVQQTNAPLQRASLGQLLHGRGNRRALLIIVAVTSIQVLCGSLTTVAYAEMIFGYGQTSSSAPSSLAAPQHELSAGNLSIIFGIVQLVAATASAVAIDWMGRRPLLLTSVYGTMVCNAVIAMTLPSGASNADALANNGCMWLPRAALMLGIVFYFIGLATVIFALLAELLPARFQRIGAAVYTLWSGALIFATNKLFQVVTDGWGMDAAFWIFAGCGALFAPILFVCVPETKGKAVKDIQEELHAKVGGWRW